MAKKVIRVNVKSPKVTSNKKASPIKVKINMKNTGGYSPQENRNYNLQQFLKPSVID